MIIKAKYKVAKRLNAPIFEKTQTAKFMASKERAGKTRRRKKMLSDYGKQLFEKQKMRFMYGISERQFRNYVIAAMGQKATVPSEKLFQSIELRLDNVVYRMGLAPTRRSARQLVSHGHITVNGRKVTVPSYSTRIGEKVSIREGSKDAKVFLDLAEKVKDRQSVAWAPFDASKRQGEVKALPVVEGELLFDLNSVLEFYSR